MAKKFFKATISAKKSHPLSPADIVHYSDQYSTAKAYSDDIKKLLEEEDENFNFYFAPKIDRIEEGEFLKNQVSEAEEEFQHFEEINHQPEPEVKTDSKDIYYWFQYTPNTPIIIKLSPVSGGFRASYKFESNFFIEIDRLFEKAENAVVNCLGQVISDCMEDETPEHHAIIKGIGSRSESAIPDALMSKADIKMMIDAGYIDGVFDREKDKFNNVKPWENNPEIEHKKLYSAIVDIAANYKGDQVPSCAECYEMLSVEARHYFNGDAVKPSDFEEKLISAISSVKNPHNFLNSTSVVQIFMSAFPRDNLSTSARLAHKFASLENNHHATKSTNSEPVETKSLPVDPEIELEAVSNEPDTPESLPVDDLGFDFDSEPQAEVLAPEKSDFEKLVNSYNEKIEALELGDVIVFEDMPNEIYHATVGISSSKIKDAMKSLMYFNAKHNTKEIEPESGSQFDIGNVFHSICLEPDLTSKEYIKEPSGDGVPAKPTQPQIDKYNEWRKLGSPEESENKKAYPTPLMFERCGFWNDFYDSTNGLYPVAAEDWELAENMVNSAMSDSDSSKVLTHPSRRCETSYFKRCEETGMIIKARPDLEVGRILADLKSISLRGNFDEKYLLTALRKEVFNRGYHISAAMYLDITGKDQFLWIFTNKQKGYHWTATIRASEEILHSGRETYLEYKQKIADAYNSGNWTKPESIQSKRNPASGKIELPEI